MSGDLKLGRGSGDGTGGEERSEPAAGSTRSLCGLGIGRDRLQTGAPGPPSAWGLLGVGCLLLRTWQRLFSVFSALTERRSCTLRFCEILMFFLRGVL